MCRSRGGPRSSESASGGHVRSPRASKFRSKVSARDPSPPCAVARRSHGFSRSVRGREGVRRRRWRAGARAVAWPLQRSHCGARYAWDFIRSALPRGQYEHSGARLCRAATVAEGIRLYKKEARKRGVSCPPQLFTSSMTLMAGRSSGAPPPGRLELVHRDAPRPPPRCPPKTDLLGGLYPARTRERSPGRPESNEHKMVQDYVLSFVLYIKYIDLTNLLVCKSVVHTWSHLWCFVSSTAVSITAAVS